MTWGLDRCSPTFRQPEVRQLNGLTTTMPLRADTLTSSTVAEGVVWVANIDDSTVTPIFPSR